MTSPANVGSFVVPGTAVNRNEDDSLGRGITEAANGVVAKVVEPGDSCAGVAIDTTSVAVDSSSLSEGAAATTADAAAAAADTPGGADTVAAADVDGGEVCEGDGCEQAPIIPGTEDPDSFNAMFDF